MATTPIQMTVRRPAFDYASTPHNWMLGNPSFGYQLNGGSLTLPYLEPYLVRVMSQARERLGDSRQGLVRDIHLFNGQETHHFKVHAKYNALLRERYEGIEALEAEIEADFARMFREESLEWNLGYSAGFETTGMVISQLYFHDVADGMSGADPAVHGLWAWHLAEEYEHRCVAFDVFRALGGSWRKRVQMFFYQARHLQRFGTRAAALMRAQDEAAGHFVITPAEQPAIARIEARQARRARLRVRRALLPWHDPRRHGPLAPADDFLRQLDWA